MKRRVLKLPSGSGSTIHYRRSKVDATRCSQCGQILFGAPIRASSELRRVSLSDKRPQRIFGGQLCQGCLRESLKRAVRSRTA